MRDLKKELQQHIGSRAEAYGKSNPEKPNVFQHFLDNGSFYDHTGPSALPMRDPNDCIKNSQFTAVKHNLPYIEGWVHHAGLPWPLPHAWNLDANGGVLDSTLPENFTDRAYFGVKVPQKEFIKPLMQGKNSAVLLKDLLSSSPTFKKQFFMVSNRIILKIGTPGGI